MPCPVQSFGHAGTHLGRDAGRDLQTAIYNTCTSCTVQTFGRAGTDLGRAAGCDLLRKVLRGVVEFVLYRTNHNLQYLYVVLNRNFWTRQYYAKTRRQM